MAGRVVQVGDRLIIKDLSGSTGRLLANMQEHFKGQPATVMYVNNNVGGTNPLFRVDFDDPSLQQLQEIYASSLFINGVTVKRAPLLRHNIERFLD